MTGNEFAALRKATGLSQADLGALLDISERTINRLETIAHVPEIYVIGIERAALKQALKLRDLDIVPASMRRDALDLAQLIRGA